MTVVLSGCTSDEGDPTVLSPAPSASSTAAPLQVPPEATADTPQGAAAFARFFFADVVNRAYETMDTRTITALSASQCNSCKNIVSDIERVREAGHEVAGQRFVIEFAEAAPAGSDGDVVVDFRFSADRYREMDNSGQVIRDVAPRVKQDAQVKLIRSGDGWLVSGIQMVEA